MPPSTPLIAIVVVGFVLAFALGLVAQRRRRRFPTARAWWPSTRRKA
jgi:MYXO-CTERM domain-containing protein